MVAVVWVLQSKIKVQILFNIQSYYKAKQKHVFFEEYIGNQVPKSPQYAEAERMAEAKAIKRHRLGTYVPTLIR